MNGGWRHRSVAIAVALALVVVLVASAAPAAAHEGHTGGETSQTTTTQQEGGGFDVGRIGIALGAGAVAAGLAGAALWLRSG